MVVKENDKGFVQNIHKVWMQLCLQEEEPLQMFTIKMLFLGPMEGPQSLQRAMFSTRDNQPEGKNRGTKGEGILHAGSQKKGDQREGSLRCHFLAVFFLFKQQTSIYIYIYFQEN